MTKPRTKQKFIHINQHNIRKNIKLPDDEKMPVVTIKHGSTNTYCYKVRINGPSEVLYDKDKPLLRCGARVVIATESEIEIIE